MGEKLIAFIIWLVMGLVFAGYGIYIFFSKKEKPFGFWANAEQFPVKDVKGYNHALGSLFFVFGIIFVLLGLPLLAGENSGWIIIPILGTMVWAIFLMVIYVTVIEKKYRMKNKKSC